MDVPSSRVCNDEFKALFIKKRSIYNELLVGTDDVFSVELVSDIVMKMKKGKAAGMDNVFCEHLQYDQFAYYYIMQAV